MMNYDRPDGRSGAPFTGGVAPGVGVLGRGAVGADKAPLVIWLRGMTANGSVGTGAGVPVVTAVVVVVPVVAPPAGAPDDVVPAAAAVVVEEVEAEAAIKSCRFAAILL